MQQVIFRNRNTRGDAEALEFTMQNAKSEQLLSLLKTKQEKQLLEAGIELGDVVIRVRREGLLDLFHLLKLDSDFQFNMLVDITAVDWFDSKENRFEVIYHLMSLPNLYRLRVKVWLPETDAQINSVVALWSGANFLEREVWDMYGIKFNGHPDLRRILMYDEFIGHPLRKDYPLQAKQPRVRLLHPEVQNTARDMLRDPLVKINTPRRKRGEPDAHGDQL